MKLETTSVQFKRTLHALTYALSLAADIDADEEKELFLDIFEDFGFSPDVDSLLDVVSKKFDDDECYDQLERGHFTGLWIQKMQKEDGEFFIRHSISNELSTPKTISTFLNRDDLQNSYIAKQVSCFFVPFNTYSKDVSFDETNNSPFSLNEITPEGKYNQVALDAVNYAEELHSYTEDLKRKEITQN